MTELLLEDETYAVTGAAIEVHRALGPGFLEKVYQEAMQLELNARRIPYEAEKPLDIHYKGRCLTQKYYADLICYGQIIVEMKTLNQLSGKEEAQILNYLKATGLQVGLLFNFGSHG
ncbi:MAG: GxxExxY protein, partial [Caldilineaceae bacterium SB0670_bin_27]|nr:GxxExxY protein [Caldilineaceae bacterium SB0670_bin_27]